MLFCFDELLVLGGDKIVLEFNFMVSFVFFWIGSKDVYL